MRQYSLIGVDGNAFSIMGYTAKAMRREGFSREDVERMHEEAMSGDYDHLLTVCVTYVDECNKRFENEQ